MQPAPHLPLEAGRTTDRINILRVGLDVVNIVEVQDSELLRLATKAANHFCWFLIWNRSVTQDKTLLIPCRLAQQA